MGCAIAPFVVPASAACVDVSPDGRCEMISRNHMGWYPLFASILPFVWAVTAAAKWVGVHRDRVPVVPDVCDQAARRRAWRPGPRYAPRREHQRPRHPRTTRHARQSFSPVSDHAFASRLNTGLTGRIARPHTQNRANQPGAAPQRHVRPSGVISQRVITLLPAPESVAR